LYFIDSMPNGFISFSLILPLSKFLKTQVTQIKSFYFQDVLGLHLSSPREISSVNREQRRKRQVFLQPKTRRVESERPILESMHDWMQEEVEGAVTEEEEEEVEEEDDTKQSQPPSSWTPAERVLVGNNTNRAHQSLAHASSTGRQSPVLAPGVLPLEENLSPFPIKGAKGIIRIYLISL
jgi:hypothetical protein